MIGLFEPTLKLVAHGGEAARFIAPRLIASAVGFVLARGFDGAGNTVPAMAINLLAL